MSTGSVVAAVAVIGAVAAVAAVGVCSEPSSRPTLHQRVEDHPCHGGVRWVGIDAV